MADKAANTVCPEDIFLNKEGQPRHWILFFRKGTQFREKGFRFDGSLNEACIRGRKHCEVMNYRFQFVRPLIVDLDYQETLYLQGKFREEQVPEL